MRARRRRHDPSTQDSKKIVQNFQNRTIQSHAAQQKSHLSRTCSAPWREEDDTAESLAPSRNPLPYFYDVAQNENPSGIDCYSHPWGTSSSSCAQSVFEQSPAYVVTVLCPNSSLRTVCINCIIVYSTAPTEEASRVYRCRLPTSSLSTLFRSLRRG